MDEFILTDYIFIFVVLTSTLFGFARGFIREMFTILNLTLAAFATYFTYPFGYEFFAQHLEEEVTIQAMSVIGLFIVSWVVIAIINSFVLDMLSGFKGGFLDRILGTAFGVLRGALVVISVYLSAGLVFSAQIDDSKLPAWLKDAGTLNYVKMQSQNFLEVAPSEYAEFYYNQEENFIQDLVLKLQRRDINEDAASKLVGLGFSVDNVKSLQGIYGELPNSTLSLQELSNLDNETLEIYGNELIKSYRQAVESGQIEGKVSENSIDGLQSTFDNIRYK